MAISSGPSSAGSPESFSFYVLKGEALGYPRGTITPRSDPLAVQVDSLPLTLEIVQAWFLQSITPLVGEAAMTELKRLIEARPELFADFLEKTMAFRQSLK